jgi:hypothetical protein
MLLDLLQFARAAERETGEAENPRLSDFGRARKESKCKDKFCFLMKNEKLEKLSLDLFKENSLPHSQLSRHIVGGATAGGNRFLGGGDDSPTGNESLTSVQISWSSDTDDGTLNDRCVETDQGEAIPD